MAEYLIRGDAEKEVHEITVGDTLHIELKDNPTTGYVWALDPLSTDALELLASEYLAAEPGSVGGGGRRVFQLLAKRPGEMTVTLKRQRRWEPAGSAIEARQFRIRIDQPAI